MSDTEKRLAIAVIVWLCLAPFVAVHFGDPMLFIAAPFLILFAGVAVLQVGIRVLDWVIAMRLRR